MSEIKYYNPESFFGFMNIFKGKTSDAAHPTMSRPAFPPIVVDPSLRDAYNHLNYADFGAFTTVVGANLIYTIFDTIKNNRLDPQRFSKHYYRWRLVNFRINLIYIFTFGFVVSFGNCSLRLAGHIYNGNRWRNTKHESKQLTMVQDNGLIGFIKRLQS